MSDDKKTVTAFRLTAAAAQKRIHELALDTQNIVWGTHGEDRSDERDIPDMDVLRILRNGWVDEPPELTKHREWKCKITLKIRGGRTAGVVVIFLHNGRLFVKTVEWEDLS